MKLKAIGLFAVACLVLTAFNLTNETLNIGMDVPKADVKMMGTQEESISLNELRKEKGLLVVFSCNTCPFVVGAPGYGSGWENRYNELYDKAAAHKIGMVLVNSNEAKRDGADSMDEMKKRAKEQAYKMPYVLDKNAEIADAFGAKTTPHVFLFDENMKLVYKGAIDDNNKEKDKVEQHYLISAMKKMHMGKPVDPNTTREMGCSIKRVKK